MDPKISNIEGALKKKPKMFSDLRLSEPNRGGGSVFVQSDLSYRRRRY